jgi:DNA-binding NarL/FixJ family response regulator
VTPHPEVPVPLRIVVADDQASVRQGLVVLLGTLPEIEVVASAANGEEAIQLVAEKSPHAILLDKTGSANRTAAIRYARDHHLG